MHVRKDSPYFDLRFIVEVREKSHLPFRPIAAFDCAPPAEVYLTECHEHGFGREYRLQERRGRHVVDYVKPAPKPSRKPPQIIDPTGSL